MGEVQVLQGGSASGVPVGLHEGVRSEFGMAGFAGRHGLQSRHGLKLRHGLHSRDGLRKLQNNAKKLLEKAREVSSAAAGKQPRHRSGLPAALPTHGTPSAGAAGSSGRCGL